MKLLIDADSIAYRAAAAAEKRIWRLYLDPQHEEYVASFRYKKEAEQWAKENSVEPAYLVLEKEYEPVVNALSNAKNIVEGILEELDEFTATLYLSSNANYRNELATIKKYKGNRENLERPKYLQEVKDYLIKVFKARVVDGYEADDAVSMELWKHGDDACCVSIDKDLDNTPGWHYNFVTKLQYYVTPEEAEAHFYYQMMVGDTVDNIKGVPKVGRVSAINLISTSTNLKCDVAMLYAKAYDDPEVAFEENARLLWMSRDSVNDWSW